MKIENEMSDRQIAEQILTTHGVTSCVHIPEIDEQYRRNRSTLHCGLYDFDIVPSKTWIMDRTLNMEGVNILWESSRTPSIIKYHLWNLTCQTVDEIALHGLKLNADCKHVSHGFRRFVWVLRVAPKIRDGKIYKPHPTFLHTWSNPSQRPQSLPHLNLFQALTGENVTDVDCYDWIGNTAQIETYMSLTDKMKELFCKIDEG